MAGPGDRFFLLRETAIGILLKNGIRPDLHVENENTFPLVKNLREFKKPLWGLKVFGWLRRRRCGPRQRNCSIPNGFISGARR